MNFLIVLTAVLMVHQGEWISYVQRDEWLSVWWRKLIQDTALQSRLVWVVIAIPVIALAWMLYALENDWWITFLINAVVLLYAMGRGSWRTECDAWVKFFAEDDVLSLRQKLAGSGVAVDEEVSDGAVEAGWLRARSAVLYHQLDGFYTVVFWFFVLGAPMALLYRLLQLTAGRAKTATAASTTADRENHEVHPSSETVFFLWLMEWVPVRLMGLLFCLVGNFTPGFLVLKKIVRDGVTSSTDVLLRCVDAALFLETQMPEQKTVATLRRDSLELQALLHRSEWAFLVLMALTALL